MPIHFSDESEDQTEQFEPELLESPEPWWNSGDKVAGLCATILFAGVAVAVVIVLIALAIKAALWILPW